jgi:hypothetical protein
MRKKLIIFTTILASLLISGTVAYASTWTYYFPITIVDTSNTTREYLPVLVGQGGSNLVSQGYSTVNGMDTNMQDGTTNRTFMMDTTKIGTVIPSLPSGGKVTYNLYTGYSPVQTSFPVIVGMTGNITTTDNVNMELGANFKLEKQDYISTTAGANKYLINKTGAISVYVDPVISGKVKADIAGTGTTGTTFPGVTTNTTGSGTTAAGNLTVHVTYPTYSAGDLLIIAIGGSGAGNYPAFATVNSTTTFTQLWKTNNSGGARYQTGAAWYKVAAGTEGTTGNITVASASTPAPYAWQVYKIPKNTFTGVPVVPAAVTGAASNPDPPSNTSGFGAVDTLWLAISTSTDVDETAAPANYTGLLHNGLASGYIQSAQRRNTTATENPGTFNNAADEWVANTIAIKGYGILASASVTGVTSGLHTYFIYNDTVHYWLDFDHTNVSANQTSASVPNTTSQWEFNKGGSVGAMNYYKHTVGGVLIAWWQPTTMIVGTTLIDRQGGDNPGTINFGANTNVTVIYGTAVANTTTSVVSTSAGGFVMPTLTKPASWEGGATDASLLAANVPFYQIAHDASLATGMPIQNYYFMMVMATAFILAILVGIATHSAFFCLIIMAIVEFIGTGMGGGVVPMWIPVMTLIVDILIIYLYPQLGGRT